MQSTPSTRHFVKVDTYLKCTCGVAPCKVDQSELVLCMSALEGAYCIMKTKETYVELWKNSVLETQQN